MSDRIHVTMALDLFVEDAEAMRQAAFERMSSAWSSDEDFPYESAADVPLDQAVHSLLADALPADLPGCRRSQLDIEVEEGSGMGSGTDSSVDSDDADASEAAPSEDGEGGQDDDSDDESPEENSSSDEPTSSEDPGAEDPDDPSQNR